MTEISKYHIAIIDDESSVTETISFFLGQFYRVSVFSDGSDFLKSVESEKPDLIISDFMMENMDGITLTKQLRKIPDFADVPIILITALGDTELENARQAGISEYITKPFDIRDVLHAIERYLGPVKK